MNRLTLAILGSAITMFVVLMVFDINQLITTPLTPYGVNHWIPELLAVFLFGKLLTRINKTLLPVIVGCVFLFPILTYVLMDQLSFGIGTSSVFVAVLIMGIWSGSKQEAKEKLREEKTKETYPPKPKEEKILEPRKEEVKPKPKKELTWRESIYGTEEETK